jgi:parallel beta-helix repeat protein
MRRCLLALACGALCAACGSGPAAPSAPGAPVTISITGSAALSLTQTTQLRASSSGLDVTGAAAWRSSDPEVARVSSAGLVTTRAAGTTEISATWRDATGILHVVVTPVVLSEPVIMACGNIVAPGAYVIGADLSQTIFPDVVGCVNIMSSAVQLDCAHHAVSAVRALGVSGVTVTNCRGTVAIVSNSTNVTFEHNALATIDVVGGGSNLITQNTASVITLHGSNGNQVSENVLDGGYDGNWGQVGQDDGILLIDEANDTIQDNTIRNYYDAGIEGVDAVANTRIENNTIVNAAFAGIGAYWCTSWTGNTIRGNGVTRSPRLMFSNFSVGPPCRNLSTVGAFTNNQIVGNRFSSPTYFAQPINSLYLNFGAMPMKASSVTNNLVQDNDLGTAPGPFTNPES